jgi:ribose transport system substrate-binding protein
VTGIDILAALAARIHPTVLQMKKRSDMKRYLVWLSMVVVVVFSSAALAACGGAAAPANPTAAPAAPKATTAPAAAQPTTAPAAQPTTAPAAQPTSAPAVQGATPAAAPTQAGNKTIVFIPKSTNSTFWLALLQGARDAATEIGGYNEVLYQGVAQQTDISGQVNVVNAMVQRKVDGILLAATDAKALAPAVENAIKAGVPVITVDSGVESQAPLAYIATDNPGAAVLAADTLAKLVDNKGKVGDIGITAGSQTGREREDGFVGQIKAKYPDIKVVPVQYSGCDPAKGLNIASDMATGNPDLNAFYGACDGAGTGAGQLVKSRGMQGKVKVVSFDVSPDEFQLFLDGYIDAMIVQDPWSMGNMGLKGLDKVIKGGTIENKNVSIPAVVVTKDNLKDPKIQKLLSTYPDIAKMLPKQ